MIKFKILIPLSLIFIQCENKKIDGQQPPHLSNNSEIQSNKVSCIDGFKNFRDLIYSKNMAEVKKAFSFPIKKNNDVWNLIFIDDDSTFDSNKNFTELDFEKYYDKLFPSTFVKSLLKIKSKELFDSGKYVTPKLETQNEDYNEIYYMTSEYNPVNQKLILSVNSEYYENKEKVSETAIIYYFTIDSQCKIKFEKILLAG